MYNSVTYDPFVTLHSPITMQIRGALCFCFMQHVWHSARTRETEIRVTEKLSYSTRVLLKHWWKFLSSFYRKMNECARREPYIYRISVLLSHFSSEFCIVVSVRNDIGCHSAAAAVIYIYYILSEGKRLSCIWWLSKLTKL